jgi:hypothetical protein
MPPPDHRWAATEVPRRSGHPPPDPPPTSGPSEPPPLHHQRRQLDAPLSLPLADMRSLTAVRMAHQNAKVGEPANRLVRAVDTDQEETTVRPHPDKEVLSQPSNRPNMEPTSVSAGQPGCGAPCSGRDMPWALSRAGTGSGRSRPAMDRGWRGRTSVRCSSVDHQFEHLLAQDDHGVRGVNSTPRLEGMHAATASTTGWIEARAGGGPQCLFCGEPARAFKPLDQAGSRRLSGCGGAGRARPPGWPDRREPGGGLRRAAPWPVTRSGRHPDRLWLC